MRVVITSRPDGSHDLARHYSLPVLSSFSPSVPKFSPPLSQFPIVDSPGVFRNLRVFVICSRLLGGGHRRPETLDSRIAGAFQSHLGHLSSSPPLPNMADLENPAMDESFAASEIADDQAHGATASATVGTRRQANGTIGSVYSGNKIRHLKKEDGIPLWRKDIQYQFLKLVFEDKTPAFTRYPDGQKNMDFADVYIDAMARSSKTSKILKDKLQNDKPAAISMAMVCLLVNFGRMNTTLNCTSCCPLTLRCPCGARSFTPFHRNGYADNSSFAPFSLPRDACSAPNLPLHPFATSPPGLQCLQAIAGRPSFKVYIERRI